MYGSGRRFDGPSTSSEAALVEDGYESSEILMVLSSADDCEWIMKFSYLFHMIPNHLWFQQFVLLSDNMSYKIIGIGTIKFHLHDITERMLKEVRYVPSLKRNLISLSELEKKGYVFKGERGAEGGEGVHNIHKGYEKE